MGRDITPFRNRLVKISLWEDLATYCQCPPTSPWTWGRGRRCFISIFFNLTNATFLENPSFPNLPSNPLFEGLSFKFPSNIWSRCHQTTAQLPKPHCGIRNRVKVHSSEVIWLSLLVWITNSSPLHQNSEVHRDIRFSL